MSDDGYDEYADSEAKQPDGEWDVCLECGAWAYHDFITGSWEAKRPEMDDCARCQTCGG